jgi:hypothetical protein
MVAGVRWADRVGKGIRTAPRDALVADSIDEKHSAVWPSASTARRYRRRDAGGW